MPDEILSCVNGNILPKVGTFVVGDEPFNHTENHTVYNNQPDKPLDELTTRVYDMSGNAATISNQFNIRMRLDK
jgi:hypothetical protein